MAIFTETSFTPAQARDVLQRVFPNAKIESLLLAHEWVERIVIGFFQIKAHAYQRQINKHSPGEIVVSIDAIRVSTDNSGALIWGKTATGLIEYEEVLVEVREHLMGIAAGVVFICGKSPAKAQQQSKPQMNSAPKVGVQINPGIPPPSKGQVKHGNHGIIGNNIMEIDPREKSIDAALDILVEANARKRARYAPSIKPLPQGDVAILPDDDVPF